MNQCFYLRSRKAMTLVICVLGTAWLVLPSLAIAQEPSKIRLMADTLRARDSGDLVTAKAKAEALIKVAPEDVHVHQLLASINDALDKAAASRDSVPPPIVSGGLSSAPQKASTIDVPLTVTAPAELEALVRAQAADDSAAQRAVPNALTIEEVSPSHVAQAKITRDLLVHGRTQFLHGDYEGAAQTFREVEARDANNKEAKLFSKRIALVLGGIHAENLYKTREQMLTEVDQQWDRPKVFDIAEGSFAQSSGPSLVQQKLSTIVIPQVNFSNMELTRVLETLSELSLEYDPDRIGVNIVPLFNPSENNPRVNISLRNLSLDRILQFVTQQVNFTYEVGADAVTVSPSFGQAGTQSTVTEFFPISAGTVIRLTGFGEGGAASVTSADPFAAAIEARVVADDKTNALQAFFQRAGVNFGLPGASLAFDGEQLIVTQTRQNLDRMRAILRNYSEVKQVEIEAKFLEVAQGDLEELGFNWTHYDGESKVSQFKPRSLADAFGVSQEGSEILIDGVNKGSITPPVLPSVTDLATDVASGVAGATFSKAGIIGLGSTNNLDLELRALSRKSGTDLMSAPKVTVLSGKRATISVAQELRYPESYGDIESTASTSSGAGDEGGGSSISITAGTPEDFVTRNVGVELAVTPNVENDDSISLILEPTVTEFEGFVEYGGPSIAISGGTTVTVPAGFYQPIFSTRQISTEVTVFDGATLVMGGLTRDEVKTVSDKVPLLGDIPGVGRLFRSEGETRQKRNLLIFVTANLVSPGGSLARQNYPNAKANALFQNPTVMTPSGAANRSVDLTEE